MKPTVNVAIAVRDSGSSKILCHLIESLLIISLSVRLKSLLEIVKSLLMPQPAGLCNTVAFILIYRCCHRIVSTSHYDEKMLNMRLLHLTDALHLMQQN